MRARKTITICLALIFILVTGLVASRRASKGSNDFDTFHEAGRSVIEGRGIYYTGDYYADSRTRMGPFLYPPMAAIFFVPVSWMPLPVGAFLWNLINVVLFEVCLAMCLFILGISRENLPGFLKNQPLPLQITAVFVVLALFLDNLTMAQMNIAVLFFTLGAFYFSKKNQPFFAGLSLSAAIILKVTPLLFIFYFTAKRSWKILASTAAGILLFTLVIPTLVFGLNTNRVYHRQWVGRMFKPAMVDLIERWRPEKIHPHKSTPEKLRSIHLGDVMVDKNQSLEGTLSRWLLKNRNDYADRGSYPIAPLRAYKKLPVLFGGLSEGHLKILVTTSRVIILIWLLFMLLLPKQGAIFPLEISLLFLSIPLLSPLARSHQFIVWIFPCVTLFWVSRQEGFSKKLSPRLLYYFYAACFFYAAQAIPYGKAAGMGTLGDLIFFSGFSGLIFAMRHQRQMAERPAL